MFASCDESHRDLLEVRWEHLRDGRLRRRIMATNNLIESLDLVCGKSEPSLWVGLVSDVLPDAVLEVQVLVPILDRMCRTKIPNHH